MKWTTFTLFILSSMFSFAQFEEYTRTGNPYLKYAHQSFECSFQSSDKRILADCQEKYKSQCYHFLSSSFGADSTYLISLTLLEKKNSAVVSSTYNFKGKFNIDADGNIHLLGEHPFKSGSIRIKDKKHRHYTYTLRYRFELNDMFKNFNHQKLFAYCDGACEIYKETE